MLKIFIDATGWKAVIDKTDPNHIIAKEYYQSLLEKQARFYTNIIELDKTISVIKNDSGAEVASEFTKAIEEASLTANLIITWETRRLRRAALKRFFLLAEQEVDISHCLICEEVHKKKLNFIFSFDNTLRVFSIPLMPQAQNG